MARSHSTLLAAVAAVSLLAGPVPAAAADPPLAPSTVDGPDPAWPELTTADPLDGGEALPPSRPVNPLPESGASRLGAADVALDPLTFSFKATAYGINEVPREIYPYARSRPIALVDTGVHDAAGVRMYKIGTRLYDHPVLQAQYGIENLESYRVTNDVRYLNRAKAQAGRLTARADKIGNAWYLPYPFDFNLHGRASDRMSAPWYSAMAQGLAVTLFVRLHEVTGDETYRNAADGVFATFLRPRATAKPWVVWVDSQRHLWLEEYPAASPDRTLNGHLFAIFGLWDYWRLTQDERATTLYRGALTTVADYFWSYRRAKWTSRYCLTHPTVQSEKYHLIHIGQLLKAFSLTRSVVFARLADVLAQDYPPPTVSGSVAFAAGTHQGVKFTSAGKVSSRKSLRLTRASYAPADRRARILGQPGLWYRITKGALAGYYVQERYAIVALRGQWVTYRYYPARRVTLVAGRSYIGYDFAPTTGAVRGSVTVTPTEDTAFGVVSGAVWSAREYVLAESGPLAGRWISRASLVL